MKTNKLFISISGVIFRLLFILIVPSAYSQLPADSVRIIKGHVIDSNTKTPLSYANVYLTNTGIGIVANSEGEFILKVPASFISNKISFSYLGYQTQYIDMIELNKEDNKVKLNPQDILLKEVIIQSNDPLLIIKKAVSKISENYGKKPYECTAFYRESIKQNKRYVSVAEGVFYIYKASYNREYDSDRFKLFKGRKSEDKKYIDTLTMKLRGGIQGDAQLDVVKNLPLFLDDQNFESYNYKPVTLISLDGDEAYVIEFEAKKEMPDAMYNGKIYIDINTLAIKKVEFSISPFALYWADKMLILKKPSGMNIKTVSGMYDADYRYMNGKWTLNHIHIEVKFKVDKKRHLFSRLYTISSDFVITDKDTLNVTRFKHNETIKQDGVFIEQVSNYYDKDFWGPYNVIIPEEAIETVIERISKKMKKNNK